MMVSVQEIVFHLNEVTLKKNEEKRKQKQTPA